MYAGAFTSRMHLHVKEAVWPGPCRRDSVALSAGMHLMQGFLQMNKVLACMSASRHRARSQGSVVGRCCIQLQRLCTRPRAAKWQVYTWILTTAGWAKPTGCCLVTPLWLLSNSYVQAVKASRGGHCCSFDTSLGGDYWLGYWSKRGRMGVMHHYRNALQHRMGVARWLMLSGDSRPMEATLRNDTTFYGACKRHGIPRIQRCGCLWAVHKALGPDNYLNAGLQSCVTRMGRRSFCGGKLDGTNP